MKSLDIVVMCKLLVLEKKEIDWSYKFLSEQVFLSVSETHASVKRLVVSRIFNETRRQLLRTAVLELVLSAIKYVFPASKGSIVRGMPTAHSAPVFDNIISQDDLNIYVWPYAKGIKQGISVSPLSKSAHLAAEIDQDLYDLLALIDAVRIGKAREKAIAEERLNYLILGYNEYN